jgi:hypothetical protein
MVLKFINMSGCSIGIISVFGTLLSLGCLGMEIIAFILKLIFITYFLLADVFTVSDFFISVPVSMEYKHTGTGMNVIKLSWF